MITRHTFRSILNTLLLLVFTIASMQTAFALRIDPLSVSDSEGAVVQLKIFIDAEDWVKPDDAARAACANIGISPTFVARYALDRHDGSAQFGLSESSRDLHLAYSGIPKGDLDIVWCITGPSGGLQSDTQVTLHLHEDDEEETTESASLTLSKVDLAGNKTAIRTIAISIADVRGEINENECSSTPISKESPSATGSLTESDCDDSPRGSRYLADIYTYEGTQGETLPVHVDWEGVDGYIYLEAPNGAIEAQNDDLTDESDSHIEGPLKQTGTYRIWVTTKNRGDTGDYEISLTSNERKSEADWRLSNTTVTPTVLAPDDELSISVVGHKNGTFSFYGAGRADVVYLLSTDAEISESDLTLGSSSHCCASNFENVWQGAIDVAPGTYWAGACITNEDVEPANDCSTGTQIIVEGSNSCGIGALACGDSLSGQLGGDSCTATAGPLGPDFHAERFTFTAEAGETIWLNANWAFDGYLMLNDPAGELVAENDNYLDPANSRIEHTLKESGTYTVWATTYEPGAAGAYDLALECSPPDGPDMQVDTPQAQATVLNAGQRLDLDTRLHNAGTLRADSTTLRYVLSSDSRIDRSDPEIGSNRAPSMAAGESMTLSRALIAPVTPGSYWLGACADAVADEAAVTNNCSAGLMIEVQPQPQCTSRAATCGQQVSATISPEDCSQSPRGTGYFSEVLELEAEAGGSLVADASWSGFDGYLLLEDPSGNVVASNDDATGPLHSRIEHAVEQSGTHRLWVTSFERRATGSYDVEVTCGAEAEPDLVASPVSVSAVDVEVEDTVTLSARVDNVGGSASAPGTVHFMLSPDKAISLDDPVVASLDLDAISAGAGVDAEVSVTVPSAAGNYWAGICVDAVDGETLTSNNCSSAPAAGSAGTLVNVSAGTSCSSVDLSCGEIRSGALGAENCDRGPRGVGFVTDMYSFSGSAGDRVSLRVDWTDLDGYLYLEDPNGEVAAESDDFQGPGSSRIEHVLEHSGTYHVWPSAHARGDGGSYELDFGCDSLAGPDLRVDAMDLSATAVRPGQVVSVEAEVLNQGGEAAADSAVHFILANGPEFSAGDRVLGRADVPALEPGGASVETMSFALDVPPGTYWMAACIDPDVLEAESGDNCTMDGPLTVESTGRPIDITPQLNDAWYNPATSGQGFFVNVFPNDNQMFVSWFTFDSERPEGDVPFELGDPGHRWLVALGSYERGVATLDIYLNEGGVFDQSQPAPTERVYGSMTVTFSDCNHGQIEFDLPETNRQGTIPITRVASDNMADCQAQAGVLESGAGVPLAGVGPADPGADAESVTNSFDINAGLNDAWYNPSTSGQGFSFNVFSRLGAVFMSWFTYDTERPPAEVPFEVGAPGHRWLTAVGKFEGDRAELVLYRVAGGVFNSGALSPEEEEYGSVTVRFDDCQTGELHYDIPSLSREGVVPIRRLVPDTIPACEQTQSSGLQDRLEVSPADKTVLENFCGGTATWRFDWPDVSQASSYTVELWRNDAQRPMTFAVGQSEFDFQKHSAVPDAHRTGWKWRYRANHSASGTSAAFTPFFTFDVAACDS